MNFVLFLLMATMLFACGETPAQADGARTVPDAAFPRILIHNFLTELEDPAIEALAQDGLDKGGE